APSPRDGTLGRGAFCLDSRSPAPVARGLSVGLPASVCLEQIAPLRWSELPELGGKESVGGLGHLLLPLPSALAVLPTGFLHPGSLLLHLCQSLDGPRDRAGPPRFEQPDGSMVCEVF